MIREDRIKSDKVETLVLDEMDKLRQNKFFGKFMKIIRKQTRKETRFVGVSATLEKEDVALFSKHRKKFKIVSSQKLSFLTTKDTKSGNIDSISKEQDSLKNSSQDLLLGKRRDKITKALASNVKRKKVDLNLPNLRQVYIPVPHISNEKNSSVSPILENLSTSSKSPNTQFFKKSILEYLLKNIKFKKCLVFISHNNPASPLKSHLSDALNEKVLHISGAMSQKERLFSLNQFKQKTEARILICTDLLSRGIDVEVVDLVFHFDPPHDVPTYFHRVGRCGRFQNYGCSFVFVDHTSLAFLKNHEKFVIDFKMAGDSTLDFKNEQDALRFISEIGYALERRSLSRKSIISRLLNAKSKKISRNNRKSKEEKINKFESMSENYLKSFDDLIKELNFKITNLPRSKLNTDLVGANGRLSIGGWVESDVELFDSRKFKFVKDQETLSVSSVSLNDEEKELIGDF